MLISRLSSSKYQFCFYDKQDYDFPFLQVNDHRVHLFDPWHLMSEVNGVLPGHNTNILGSR